MHLATLSAVPIKRPIQLATHGSIYLPIYQSIYLSVYLILIYLSILRVCVEREREREAVGFVSLKSSCQAECVFATLEIGRRRCLQQDSRRGFQVTVVVDMTGLNVSFMDRKALALWLGLTVTYSRLRSSALERLVWHSLGPR